jgi:hypothetical protein
MFIAARHFVHHPQPDGNQFMPSRPNFVMSILIVFPSATRLSKLYSSLQVFQPKTLMYACIPRVLPISGNEAPHMRFGPPPVTVRSSFHDTHFFEKCVP